MPVVDSAARKNQLNIFAQEWLGMELNKNHELYKLKNLLDYSIIDEIVSEYYTVSPLGRPKHEGLALCCMLMLQNIYNLSDRQAARAFSENPYYQNFCGFQYFQKDYSISSYAILRFRNCLGVEGMKKILSYTLKIAINTGIVKKKTLRIRL